MLILDLDAQVMGLWAGCEQAVYQGVEPSVSGLKLN